ncbi:hypothetical protein AcW1_005382 [Taiwanofungus camphoratus]|nr:hypothetical protein AcV5_005700 [Antrodia cinnamomea]KAI0933595.1 hypothetical protein AcV5_005700 [Antrodia cinnamomea]KAI0956784.1 hypothetical protein AcW1_005382 [Antrodia cinnamomea]
MALPCVEVAEAPSSEAFRANPKDTSIVQPALGILKSSKGIVKIYYGLQTEDEKHAFIYNVWEALEDHKRLQADPVVYPELGKYDKNVFARTSDVIHIQPTSEPYKALGAPVTELAYITVKPGQSKEKVEELVDALAKAVDALPAEWGEISASWGPTVEKDDVLGLMIGWTSVDAHWNTVKTVPEVIETLNQIRQVADITLTHAALTEWN